MDFGCQMSERGEGQLVSWSAGQVSLTLDMGHFTFDIRGRFPNVKSQTSHVQLEKRLISFAASILALSAMLPKTPQGRHERDDNLARTHRREFFAFTGQNSRDCRGKPRIVPNYRSINSDSENIARLGDKSGQLVVWSSKFDIRHGTFDM